MFHKIFSSNACVSQMLPISESGLNPSEVFGKEIEEANAEPSETPPVIKPDFQKYIFISHYVYTLCLSFQKVKLVLTKSKG